MNRLSFPGRFTRWLLFPLGTLAIFLVCLIFFTRSAFASQAEAEVDIAQGVLAYEHQQYAQALSFFQQATQLDPQNIRGHYYTGLTYLAVKQPERAVEPFKTALQLRPSDADIQYQLGVAYFSTKAYDKAGPLLESIFQQTPDRENLGYYVGLTRYQNKNYSEAVEAFDKNVTSNTNLQQLAKFYRGLSLGVLGLSQEAVTELEAAQRIQAVSPITSSSIRIRDELLATRRVTDAKRFRAQISVGGYYDDNVPINPEPETIADANQQLTLNDFRRRKATSPGMLASVLLDYAFFRSGPMEATATYSFFQTLNANNYLHQLNLQNHLVGLSGFYRGVVSSMPYQLGLQYTYDYLFLNMDGFLSRHTPTFSGTLIPPTFKVPGIGDVSNLTNILIRYQVKEFFRETADQDSRFLSESRDAYNVMTGFLHTYRFAQDRFLIRLGYQFDNESADGGAFSYRGHRLVTGWQVTTPWGNVTLRHDYDVYWRDYKNAQSLFTDEDGILSPRDDRQQTHLVQLIKPLPYNLTFTLQYQRIDNRSDIPVYDYSKDVFTGLVTWNY